MVVCILLVYLGFLVDVPNWFYWVCGIIPLLDFINYEVDMYKKRKEK